MKIQIIVFLLMALLGGQTAFSQIPADSLVDSNDSVQTMALQEESDSLVVAKNNSIRILLPEESSVLSTNDNGGGILHQVKMKFRGFIDFLITFAPVSWQAFLSSVFDIIFLVPLLVILLFLSFTFSLNVFIVTFILVGVNIFKHAREAYKEKLNSRYEEILTQYLFYDMKQADVLGQLNQTKGRLGRDLLIDIFLNYHRNLSGEYRERILELYEKMSLFRNSERKIRSVHAHKRVKGIRELASMYPQGAQKLILKYFSDKSPLVRNQAQIAYAYLEEDKSFGFLDHLEQKLSPWVQLNILNHIKLHEREVPSFDKWIDSPNNDVQDFSIRMIDYFQQSENAPHLIRKLDHPNEQTRSYVYNAIRHLNLFDAKQQVKEKYEQETLQNKLEILKIFRDLGDAGDFDFLASVLKEEDLDLKKAACKAFFMIGDSGALFLREYCETENAELKHYIEHVKDQRN